MYGLPHRRPSIPEDTPLLKAHPRKDRQQEEFSRIGASRSSSERAVPGPRWRSGKSHLATADTMNAPGGRLKEGRARTDNLRVSGLSPKYTSQPAIAMPQQ